MLVTVAEQTPRYKAGRTLWKVESYPGEVSWRASRFWKGKEGVNIIVDSLSTTACEMWNVGSSRPLVEGVELKSIEMLCLINHGMFYLWYC